MKPVSSQVVFLAAAGVLAVGGAVASQLFMAPPKYAGPNTEQILATSQRLETEEPKAPDADALFAQTRAAAAAAAANRRLATNPAPQPVRRNNAVEAGTTPKLTAPTRTPAPPVSTPTTTAPAAAPGANLALTGIAGSGSSREVMLFNLADHKRESGKAGDTVFGFNIAAIHDDRVEMTQGSTEVTLRLGEKTAAVAAALAAPVANASGITTVASTAVAPGSGANLNGNAGRGDWRTRMAANAAQANFAAANRNRGRGGNNNNRRRNGTTQSGARRYSNGPDSSRRYSTVSSGATNRNTFRGGGFGGFGGRGFRGQQSNQTQLEPTSNPQEARRTGAPLIGGEDVEAMFQPEAISNPQTERRTGGTSGQAFGNSNASNRNGNNRGGGNTGRNTGGRSSGTRTGNTRS